MPKDELEIVLLIIAVILLFQACGKLNSIENQMGRLSSEGKEEANLIDEEVQTLITDGKVNQAIALYAKRCRIPLIDAERTIRKMIASKPIP